MPALMLAFCLSAISQQVLTSTGFHAQNEQGMLSWTLGEPFVNTLISDESILTQGFHQGKLIVTSVVEKEILSFEIIAYPNPAKDILNLRFDPETSASLRYAVYSMQGQFLSEGRLGSSTAEISFLNQKPGLYLVKILMDETEVRIFKVLRK